MTESTASKLSSKVWDIPVRVTHWVLVLAIIGAYVTNKLGLSYFRYHVWCGYTVIVLVVFRLIWGVVGSYHAKFRNFLRGPTTILSYMREQLKGHHTAYAGHNPLGSVMVVILLLTSLLQATTGLFGNDEILNVGPLSGYVTQATSIELTSFHRKLFYWLLSAIVIHVLAVVSHRIFRRENLLTAMFSGSKRGIELPPHQRGSNSRIWLALLLVTAISFVLWWLVSHAPVADDPTL